MPHFATEVRAGSPRPRSPGWLPGPAHYRLVAKGYRQTHVPFAPDLWHYDRAVMTVPNLLTLARLAALPVVIALSRTGRPAWAAGVFLAAMLTDCLDGWLARRLDQQSVVGRYLDPVVDKIVVLVLFYELAHQGLVPVAVPHLFLARELLQNGVRAAAAARGTVVGANRLGKTKAVLQTAVLSWGLLVPKPGSGVAVAAWGVLLLSWGFFVTFFARNRRHL